MSRIGRFAEIVGRPGLEIHIYDHHPDAEDDVARAYQAYANCYIRKPIDLNRFIDVVKVIENFWLSIVELPPNS